MNVFDIYYWGIIIVLNVGDIDVNKIGNYFGYMEFIV